MSKWQPKRSNIMSMHNIWLYFHVGSDFFLSSLQRKSWKARHSGHTVYCLLLHFQKCIQLECWIKYMYIQCSDWSVLEYEYETRTFQFYERKPLYSRFLYPLNWTSRSRWKLMYSSHLDKQSYLSFTLLQSSSLRRDQSQFKLCILFQLVRHGISLIYHW